VAEAIDRLERALAALPESSKARRIARSRPTRDRPLLAVDGVIDNHMSPRPHLPWRGRLTGPGLRASTPAAAFTGAPLPALTLDPLTAVDDSGYYKALGSEANLPADVRDGLAALGPR
jgi:hypothetical protein